MKYTGRGTEKSTEEAHRSTGRQEHHHSIGHRQTLRSDDNDERGIRMDRSQIRCMAFPSQSHHEFTHG